MKKGPCIYSSEAVKKLAEDSGISLPRTKVLTSLWIANAKKEDSTKELPTVKELLDFRDTIKLRETTYNNSEYSIYNKHIFNKSGEEVFSQESKHRNRIYANLAVKEKRAVMVRLDNMPLYIVNKDGLIISDDGTLVTNDNFEGKEKILEYAAKKFDDLENLNKLNSIENIKNSSKFANLVISTAESLGIKFIEKNLNNNDSELSAISGKFVADKKTIYYDPKHIQQNTILHEAIHSITSYYFDISDKSKLPKNIQIALREIKECYNLLKDDYIKTHFYENGKLKKGIDVESAFNFWISGDNSLYGYTSPKEMIAEINKPEFLENIKDFDRRHKGTNILDRIINAVLKLFNINKNYSSLEKTIKDAILELINNPSQELINRYALERKTLKENIKKLNEDPNYITILRNKVFNETVIEPLLKINTSNTPIYITYKENIETIKSGYSLAVNNKKANNILTKSNNNSIFRYFDDNGSALLFLLYKTPTIGNDSVSIPLKALGLEWLSTHTFDIKTGENGVSYIDNIKEISPSVNYIKNNEVIKSNTENKKVKGENISSKGSELAKKLTNVGNDITVEYKGVIFRNAEHAYQTWKSGEFDNDAYTSTNTWKPKGTKPVNKKVNYQIMVEIITAKLLQHPELLKEINEAGGLEYIKNSTHNVIGDRYWETNNGQNKFIEALAEAYSSIPEAAKEYEGFSGGAYGSDTMWDIIGEEYGVINFNHYRASNHSKLSRKLYHSGKEAKELSKKELDSAKAAIKKLLGLDLGDSIVDDLKARNYYQVFNSDAIYAIAPLTASRNNVTGGTSIAVSLGIKMNKPVYVWDTSTKKWYVYRQGRNFVETETPRLTKKFAAIGTRDIENYSKKDKEGNWIDNPNYLGEEVEQAAIQAIRDVYEKTFNSDDNSTNEIITTPEISADDFNRDIDEAERVLSEYNNLTFDTPQLTNLEEQDRIKRDFTPKDREIITKDIARIFRNEVTNQLEKAKDKLKQDIKNLSEDKSDPKNKLKALQLKESLSTLNRKDIIRSLTPEGIFSIIKDKYNSYLEMSEEEKYDFELSLANDSYGEDEENKEIAKKRVPIRTDKYTRIINNFNVFSEDASSIINNMENIIINNKYLLKDTLEEEKESIDDEASNTDNLEDGDTVSNDNYSSTFREVNPREKLSKEIKFMLNDIPRLDKDGFYVEDELGNILYTDSDLVYNTLMVACAPMCDPSDLFTILDKLSESHTWAEQIKEKLEEDLKTNGTLFSQFYQDFSKTAVNYWIQTKKILANGAEVWETVPISMAENIEYLFNKWRDNYEGGVVLSKEYSLYNSEGKILLDNVNKARDKVKSLRNEYNNHKSKDFKEIKNLLGGIGIDVSTEELSKILIPKVVIEGINPIDMYSSMLGYLDVIYSGVIKNKEKLDIEENNDTEDIEDNDIEDYSEYTSSRKDLISLYKSNYYKIANILLPTAEGAIQSSSRENNKTYYGHSVECKFDSTEKRLKNTMKKSEEEYQKFIKEEYLQYDWFYDAAHNIIKSDIIKKLKEDPKAREVLDHKVLLHSDKIEYSNKDILEYALSIYNEYFSIPESEKGGSIGQAWYPIPVISDTSSEEYIKFYRYTGKNYKEIILEKLVDLVSQEYDRINLVNKRSEKYYNEENSNIEPLGNYDLLRDEEGNISNKGGSEFLFIPKLNSYKFSNGESFLERINREAKDPLFNLKDSIKEALSDIMNENFKKALIYWERIGMLEKTSDGKVFKHLNINAYDTTATLISLQKAIEMKEVKDNETLYTSMKNLIKYIQEDNNFNDIEIINRANEIIEEANKLTGYNNKITNKAIKNLEELYWNSTFMTAQTLQLIFGDLAFTHGVEDAQKRIKGYFSPGDVINTEAYYKGEKVGKETETTIYLKDNIIKSEILDEITSIMKDRGVSKEELDIIETTFGKYIDTKGDGVNVADAQAFRSISSYRRILQMSGNKWSDDAEEAYQRFQDGSWQTKDLLVMWQVIKPLVDSFVTKDSGIKDENGKEAKLKVPIMHKNSEFPLFAMYQLMSGPLGKGNSKLAQLHKFMEDFDIDVVQFESAVKLGKQGVIDINDMNSNEVYDYLKRKTKLNSKGDEGDANIVHHAKYRDYRVQSYNPPHLLDIVDQTIGTQIRKLIAADIDENISLITPELKDIFNNLINNGYNQKLPIVNITPEEVVRQGGLNKKQWNDLYNAINVENIIQSYIKVDDQFLDPKEIEKLLKQEIEENPRYGTELKKACMLDENGEFILPLYDNVQSQRVQELVSSIVKSRVTKQRIRGAALIQVSAYGLSDNLNIVLKDKDGNSLDKKKYKENNPKATDEDYEKFRDNAIKNGDLAIDYFECYMPAYSRKFFEPLMDPNTGMLDINKLPEELRKAIGYRVPTEDKYSMAPLHIKGFLPQQCGSAIMLPREITAIAGSDFDVDKLYIMLPDFTVRNKINMKKAWNAFYKDPKNKDIVDNIKLSKEINFERALNEELKNHPEIDPENLDKEQLFKNFISGHKQYEWIGGVKERFSKWLKTQNLEDFDVKKEIKKIQYDFTKEPKDQPTSARNNLMLDLMYSVLTNKDTASKILNPGGYEVHKRAASIILILSNLKGNESVKILKSEISKIDNTKKLDTLDDICKTLNSLDSKSLKKLASKTTEELDPLSPTTQLIIQHLNMVGKQLVAVYANHVSNHAAIQYTQLEINRNKGGFKLFGRVLTSLHNIKNDKNEFISRNNAGYVASAVDNGKDHIPAYLNQNLFTADASMLLSRLGYNPIEVGIFMNQPIIKDITEYYFRNKKSGMSKFDMIDTIIKNYAKNINITDYKDKFTIKDASNQEFGMIDMMKNIIYSSNTNSLKSSVKESYYNNQIMIGMMFERILSTADALGKIVKVCRADTTKGGAGPSLEDTIDKLELLEEIKSDMNSPSYPLDHASVLNFLLDPSSREENIDINKLRQQILNSPMPIIQAFFTLGLESSERLFSNYFINYNTEIRSVINEIKFLSKTDRLSIKTKKSIIQDIIAFYLTKIDFFGRGIYEEDINNTKNLDVSIENMNMRDKFLNNFIPYYNKMKEENPELEDLELIKGISVIKAGKKSPIDILVFKNAGKISKDQRERITRDWENMLYSKENPKLQEFALNLFRYGFYRGGLGYAPNMYSHFAPIDIRLYTPDYVKALRELRTVTKNQLINFSIQYYRNHSNNKEIVGQIAEVSKEKDGGIFIDENGDLKDIVQFFEYPKGIEYKNAIVTKKIGDTFISEYKFAITRKYKGKFYYYELVNTNGKEATYSRKGILGHPNIAIEYDINSSADDMVSVIKKNRFNYNESKELLEQYTLSDKNINYDEAPDNLDPLLIDLADIAYEKATHDYLYNPLTNEINNSIESIEPNLDYLDADGKFPCD